VGFTRRNPGLDAQRSPARGEFAEDHKIRVQILRGAQTWSARLNLEELGNPYRSNSARASRVRVHLLAKPRPAFGSSNSSRPSTEANRTEAMILRFSNGNTK